MNIQIFGVKKCFDTRKAQRFFKERGIKFQYTDLAEKCMSKGELNSVIAAAGSADAVVDPDCWDQETLSLLKYLSEADKTRKIFENQQVIKTPVVRNGRQATVGYRPEVWKGWE